MTRRLRRVIFFVFVFLFMAASAVIVLFAQGYRFDFSSLKFVKTGGIFAKTSIDGAKIYINDEYIDSTRGILNHSVLIGGLTPGIYNILIYKENYYPWNKTIEVKDGLVSEFGNIILFPLVFEKNKIVSLPLQTVSKFYVKDGQVEIVNGKKKVNAYDLTSGGLIENAEFTAATSSKEIISPDKDKKIYVLNNQLWVEYLNGVKKEPIKKAGGRELLASYDSPISFFDWIGGSDYFAWFSGGELNISELDDRGGKRNSVKIYLNIASPIFWNSADSSLYFFENTKENSVLYKLSL